MQILHYRSLEPKGFGCFTNTRSIRLKTIAGHAYGASTKTFYSQRHKMVSNIREAAVKRVSQSRSSISSDSKGRKKSILSLTDPFEDQLDQENLTLSQIPKQIRSTPTKNIDKIIKKQTMAGLKQSTNLRRQSNIRQFGTNQFHAWECLSIYRDNWSTLDLVIKDSHDMMCILHAISHIDIPCPQDQETSMPMIQTNQCLKIYKQLRMRMKLSYMCVREQLKPHDLIMLAIKRTLADQKILAMYKLQKIMASKKGARHSS